MRSTPAEPSKELAGKQLGDCPQVLLPSEVCVLHEVSVSGKRAATAILGKRNPAGEQWPHTSLVITDRVVKTHTRTQIACSPIRGKFLGSPSAQHCVRARQ